MCSPQSQSQAWLSYNSASQNTIKLHISFPILLLNWPFWNDLTGSVLFSVTNLLCSATTCACIHVGIIFFWRRFEPCWREKSQLVVLCTTKTSDVCSTKEYVSSSFLKHMAVCVCACFRLSGYFTKKRTWPFTENSSPVSSQDYVLVFFFFSGTGGHSDLFHDSLAGLSGQKHM